MASWPAGLPQNFDTDSYSETRQDGVVRTPMENGPDKVRLRFTSTVERVTGTVTVVGSDVETFWTFYETDTLYGSVAFDWTHPRTGAATSFRFVSPPSVSPAPGGVHFVISLDLEILP